VVSYSRVCGKQQSSFSNEGIIFMANYERKLRIEVDIRRKEKVEKAMEFTKKIKRV